MAGLLAIYEELIVLDIPEKRTESENKIEGITHIQLTINIDIAEFNIALPLYNAKELYNDLKACLNNFNVET